MTDLSNHIASRYQRPESAIMITITHSACLMYGGTFEPAYLLNVSAVESHTQAATNKRNTTLMQGFLSEILGVTPDRGIVRTACATARREGRCSFGIGTGAAAHHCNSRKHLGSRASR